MPGQTWPALFLNVLSPAPLVANGRHILLHMRPPSQSGMSVAVAGGCRVCVYTNKYVHERDRQTDRETDRETERMHSTSRVCACACNFRRVTARSWASKCPPCH